MWHAASQLQLLLLLAVDVYGAAWPLQPAATAATAKALTGGSSSSSSGISTAVLQPAVMAVALTSIGVLELVCAPLAGRALALLRAAGLGVLAATAALAALLTSGAGIDEVRGWG